MEKIRKMVMALALVLCLILLGGSAFAEHKAVTRGPIDEETGLMKCDCPISWGTVPITVMPYRPEGWITFEASWLIGHRVTDSQGGYLGQISSLVIDNTNGRVALVVLSDVPKMGSRHLTIPYSSIVRTNENSFEFNPGSMEIAVTQDPGNSKLYSTPSTMTFAWVEDIYRHYGQELYWTQEGGQLPKALELYESTGLMGAEVQTPKGEEIAKVNDVVIDSSGGHIIFVVLSGIAGRGDTLVAVPFSDLSRTGGNIFVLNTTGDKLASAPNFNEIADLGNLGYADNVYGYFGVHPYWTEGEMNGQKILPSAPKPRKVVPGEIFSVDPQLEQFERHGY